MWPVQPAPAVGQAGAGSLVEFTSTEARVAATVVLVLAALGATFALAPVLFRQVERLLDRVFADTRLGETADALNPFLPTTVGRALLRVVQACLIAAAAAGLLAVWGVLGRALDVAAAAGVSTGVVTRVGITVAVFLLAYVAMTVLRNAIARYSRGADRITDHQEEVVYRIGNLAILALAVTSVLSLWGINLSGLLVGAGFLGIVVGLAARQTLGSLIAGFVLMFARPFTIGDWVRVGDHEGIVTKITILNTRLENFDGESIVIPNDAVSNKPIVNRSDRGRLRIKVDVGVDYATDPDRAQDVALAAIDDVAAVTPTPPPQAVPKAFGDSAVVLELRFWIDRPTPQQKWRAVSSVVRAVKNAYDREGIKIPFPQRELSGRAETGGFRVRDGSAQPSVDAPEASTDGGEG